MCSKVLNEDLENTEYLPSGDHPFVMEGQGTIGLEMMADVGYIRCINFLGQKISRS